MALLVRSWNLFHGNADPPRRRGYLEEMVRLATLDRPAVVCLQEVPVWALGRLSPWSGMVAFGTVTRRPFVHAASAGLLTRLHQGVLRSALAGQANAILVHPKLDAALLGHTRISEAHRERRLVQCARVRSVGVVANLHATNDYANPRVPERELARARDFAEGLARHGEGVVIAGDFNLRDPVLPGYSTGGPGIDHVLVRDLRTGPVSTWPQRRRMHNGVVLSDHPPVEIEVG